MQYYVVEYEVCALLFLAIIIARFFSHRHFPNIESKVFGAVLIVSAVDITLDIVSSYFIENALALPLWSVQSINALFYSIQSSLPPIVMMYVLMRAGKIGKQNLKFTGLLLLPAALMIVAVLLNPLHSLFFYVDPVNGYVHGKLFPLLYAMCGLYLLGSLLCITLYKKQLTKTQHTTMWAFVLVVIASVIVQIFFPRYLLTGVAIALSATMMYFTMQNPTDLMDIITGAFHYSALLLFLADMLKEKRSFKLIGVGLTDLTQINNMLGIQAGNQVLKDTAQFLKGLSSTDWVFRARSTRFIVVTMNKADYENSLAKIDERFHQPWSVSGMNIMVTPQICCLSDTASLRSAEDAIRLFDAAFANLKHDSGEHHIEINSRMLESLDREAAVDTALREAIMMDMLEVYFQPIYSIKEQRFTSAEALLRFPHPTMGMIPPSEFIPLAERSGMIGKIDEFVLTKICEFIERYDPKSFGIDNIEINISALELVYGQMPEMITKTISDYGVDPSYLLFEVTETAATASHDILSGCMHTLKENGYRFVLDDYGTGYANIVQVLNLPFAAVKLDRSLLVAHYADGESSLVLEDTINLFSKLGVATVIEGVETDEQATLVHELGADYIQGFHYARPMPIPEFLLYMRKKYNDTLEPSRFRRP